MAPLSLRIILDEGAVTRTIMFDTTTKVWDAHYIVREKILTLDPDRNYGFFLTSADDDNSGVWLNSDKTLEYYMLRDGDSVHYLNKTRNIRLRMLDETVKTLQVDESKIIQELLVYICGKIGVTNHEEYGLCREDLETPEETKSNTGTLTLRKKTKTKEKDAKLEQLSKKLKTDDNVEWLDQHKTLRECGVDAKETLLFKRRLYYSDRNVDSRDPVQLNLLYVQTRDAILNGKQVVTEDKAAEFAGIQCQIQYGDFIEEKHKPGFIENLKEFLPEQYASSWGIEKKVIKEHRKYTGLSQIEAKHIYTKTARELPTYGVTFFLVKEKHKGKKKLVPRLLGINSESILRLDEETKEILQVWLLTQVKSYRAGSESFTLNFGDYSEKEYAVKTNDAFRIRDILQGYIDIIRKRLAKPYNVPYTVGEAIVEDMIESSRGTMMQTVMPSKIIEHSLTGPSQIISADQAQQSQCGTKIVTVQEIITTRRTDTTQHGVRGEFKTDSTSSELCKRLNRLNSEGVKAVVLLSDPTNESLQQIRHIVAEFEDALPGIMKDTNEAAAGLNKHESKKLLAELDDLCAYVNTLADTTKKSDLHDPDNLMTAQDAARKIAELSTQMCFALDPKIKRCSKILSRSRKSFILDEKTESSLRRASFLNATDSACQAVEQAQAEMEEEYKGPQLSIEEIQGLERRTAARMGKLNAAIALLMNAHADHRNIDYEMAVNSMKTINEIMPDFIKDAKLLTSLGNEDANKKLRSQIIQILNGTRSMCMLTGSDDISKMRDVGNDYADTSEKLIVAFPRPCRGDEDNVNAQEKENDIMKMADEVEKLVSSLLSQSNELANYDHHSPETIDMGKARDKCADSLQGFMTCAKLTAPSIEEPHCQSALTAAAENLSSSIQNLALTCKPLVEKPGRHGFAKQIADKSFDLAKVLDKLKSTYANMNGDNQINEDDEAQQQQQQQQQRRRRLRFMIGSTEANDSLKLAHDQLHELINSPASKTDKLKNPEAQRLLSQKLGQLNAAIASLLQATSDPENVDPDMAGGAFDTIYKLAPNLVQDAKKLQGNIDDDSWNNVKESLKDILDAIQDFSANTESGDIEELNKAASKMAKTSGKLTFVINPRGKSKKADEVLGLSKSALEKSSELLSKLEPLVQNIDPSGRKLLGTAGKEIVNAAENVLKTAKVTTPSIEESRCQAVLLNAIDRLSNETRKLKDPLKLLAPQARDGIIRDISDIQFIIDKLQNVVQNDNGHESENIEEQERQRLKFIATLTKAKNTLAQADKELPDVNNLPLQMTKTNNVNAPAMRNSLSEKLARLSAAIANLLQATDNERPDLEAAAAALSTISNITPDIIRDAKSLQGSVEDNSWKDILKHLKSIVDATSGMCDNAENPQELTDSSMKVAKSAGHLTYIFNPRKKADKENEILQLSKRAVEQTSGLLSNVYQLTEDIGGEEGQKLDTAGVKVVDSAQILLKTTEITAPNIENKHCQEVLITAINRLSDRMRNLQSNWVPVAQDPKNGKTRAILNKDLAEVQSTLNKLKETCQANDLDKEKQRQREEEEKRQKEKRETEKEEERLRKEQALKKEFFLKKVSLLPTAIDQAHIELKNVNYSTPNDKPQNKVNVPATKNLLLQRLAELNAAVASLVQALSDREKPDYDAAVESVQNINRTIPAIVTDARGLQGGVEDKSWDHILDNLKSLLDITGEMCANKENPQELLNSASEFANTTGKLTFILNPRKNIKKENQIIDLAKNVVEETSVLLSNVYGLTERVGGENGEKLDTAGVSVVDSAHALLKTAEVTASTIQNLQCQQAMLSAIDGLADKAQGLQATWTTITDTPELQHTGGQLDHHLKQVESTLEKLKQACKEKDLEADDQERQRLQFVSTLPNAKSAIKDAYETLKKLNSSPSSRPIDKQNIPTTTSLISKKLAQLNAAIADLLQALSDSERPNYEAAAKAINNISALTPQITKDTKDLQGAVEEKSWNNIWDNLKTMVYTTNEICNNVEDPQALNESATKFANSAGRLTYVFTPHRNTKKENQIQDLSRCAVEQTSLLLSNVYHLTGKVGGEDGDKLDQAGVKVVGSAQVLLKTADITSPCISDVHCQESLLGSVDRLTNNIEVLKKTWKPIVQAPEHLTTRDQLEENVKIVNSTLDKIRKACQDLEDAKDSKPDYLLKNISEAKQKIKEVEKLFSEDSIAQRALESRNQAPLENEKPVMARRIELSQKLAKLNEAIVLLLQAMLDRENPDYESADLTVDVIKKLTPEIVQETIALQRNMDDNSGRIMFEEAKAICDAGQAICTSVENNSLEDLNNGATKYAQSARKLRYIVSPRSYPNKEKKILDISRSVCERASLMLSRVSRLAESVGGSEGENMSISGAQLGDAAYALFSGAQVVSSSIEDLNCQTALSNSADRLAKLAQNLGNIWTPVIHQTQHRQIGEQLTRDLNLFNSELDRLKESCNDNSDIIDQLDAQKQQVADSKSMKSIPKPKPHMEDIDNLLDHIQKNVAFDVKKNKAVERLLVEDTPLRQLASKILESAKTKAECTSLSQKDRERYSRFANDLADAVNRLDTTNAKCRDTPFDAKDKEEKALQLENAILNLQILCLQSRQKEGEMNNIIDLMEFLDDVTAAVDYLSNASKETKHNEKNALQEIQKKCNKIVENASKLSNANDHTLGDNSNMFEDTLQIEQFTKSTDDEIKKIAAVVNSIGDESVKKHLQFNLQKLTDSCNLLSFAVKSSISNTESATLEESLQNIQLIDKKIEAILTPIEGYNNLEETKENLSAIKEAQSSLTAVVASGNENVLPNALTRYAVTMAGLHSDKDTNYKLKAHLKKLTDILKMQIAEKHRRVVTWQDVNGESGFIITEKILEELQRYEYHLEIPESKDGANNALKDIQRKNNNDIKRLLATSNAPETGDVKQLNEKFNQLIKKLSSTSGSIALSFNEPEFLARSLHTTLEGAMHLASIARGLKNQDSIQNKRIEEAALEMSVATYNLLQSSESVSHLPHSAESRRKLLDACRVLNESLNNLARATTPTGLQRDCSEMARSLQLQRNFLTYEYPSCALNYANCVEALQNQKEVIEKLRSEKTMSKSECSSELRYVTSAICNSAEYATQSAYLLTLSDEDKENISKQGLVDVHRMKNLTDSLNDTCLQIIYNDGSKEISDQQTTLNKQVEQLQEAVDDACTKMNENDKKKLNGNLYLLKDALKGLNHTLTLRSTRESETETLPKIMKVVNEVNKMNNTMSALQLPTIERDAKKEAMAKDVIDNTGNLLSSTSLMVKRASSQSGTITWSTIGSPDVIRAFEILLTIMREKGAEAGYLESIKTEPDGPAKSFIQAQVDTACNWLKKPAAKENDKKAGMESAGNVIAMAEQMCEDLKDAEKDEMKQVVADTKQLLNDCTTKYNSAKASLLMERLKELRKMLERGVVTRVVEDFLDEEPLANFETLHKENDERKRKFLLEKKIAELLAQLGRVTKTAKFVADTGVSPKQELLKTSDHVELLAPSLVKAAEERIHRPDDKAAIDNYQKLLAQYAESLSKVRELCDRSVDPIDFAQAAGETMYRIKEESSDDPHKSVHTSKVIMKLCNRVIDVGMNSQNVKKEPELKKTLLEIKKAVDANRNNKTTSDWRDVTAEFMRRTGEVEAVLGGENIFKKQPEPDQPIYAAALGLHAAVREWSARDNDVVAVAKRMAVLMARLSGHMTTGLDRKQELIFTSNAIVNESKEVAALAKKLALECSDIRIRTNLLQVCDRIPTISGQLKMLTTVKGSSMGHQDSAEDKEAMNMLVGNAQNLMTSVQEVVKAAVSASVKIASQRGYKMKWRRRNYY